MLLWGFYPRSPKLQHPKQLQPHEPRGQRCSGEIQLSLGRGVGFRISSLGVGLRSQQGPGAGGVCTGHGEDLTSV